MLQRASIRTVFATAFSTLIACGGGHRGSRVDLAQAPVDQALDQSGTSHCGLTAEDYVPPEEDGLTDPCLAACLHAGPPAPIDPFSGGLMSYATTTVDGGAMLCDCRWAMQCALD